MLCHIYNMQAGGSHLRSDIRAPAGEPFDAVDRHLSTELEAKALSLAFDWGWIDRLLARPVRLAELADNSGMLPYGARLMHALLVAGEVIEAGDPLRLTARFREALMFRDLFEAKLWFSAMVAPDIHTGFDKLLTDVPAFMAESKTFELFRYDRCFNNTLENIEYTRRWVKYTTVLTKYEAPACWERISLDGVRCLLDVGGNSGELARQACARAPNLAACVFDLPVVCTLGKEHILNADEAARINFHPGDLREEPLPEGFDLISFKSVLHDWPDGYARAFLQKAMEALPPGGRVLIFERGPLPTDGRRLSYATIADLVFLPFFRASGFYIGVLEELGFRGIQQEEIHLGMPFHMIVAEKPE